MKGAHTLVLPHCPHSSYVIALPVPTLAGVGGKKVWFLNAYGSPSKGEASWGLWELLWWWYLARAKKSNQTDGDIIVSSQRWAGFSINTVLSWRRCLPFVLWRDLSLSLVGNTSRAASKHAPTSSRKAAGRLTIKIGPFPPNLCLHHVVASRAQLLGPVSA